MNFIQVTDPIYRDASFSKHVSYQVKGRDPKGEFQLSRRYKEFDALRKALVKRWPGCLIPSIPAKQMVGNLELNFVQTRMKYLNDFMLKTAQLTYLYESDEVQTFIRVPTDFCKNHEFKEKPPVELAEEYQELFQEYLYTHSSQEAERTCHDWLSSLNLYLENLNLFENSCKTSWHSFATMENEMNNMISGLNEISTFYSQTYGFKQIEISQRPSFNNPYYALLDWARAQILDCRAFIDLLSKRSSLLKTKAKAKEKLEEALKKLEAKKAGKKKISQIFSKSSKEERVAKQEVVVGQLDIELKAWEKMCKIITEKIVSFDMPALRKTIEFSLKEVLEKFTECTTSEFDEIFMQFRPLQMIYDGNFP